MKPVIINGMFRSGTTLLWRILSADEQFTIRLCEPCHPKLPKMVRKFEHYKDYNIIPNSLKLWSSKFSRKKLFLSNGQKYLQLSRYLDLLLIDGALIKFVRFNLRLSWLLSQYPDIYIINIVRDPRAVCYSYLKREKQPIQSSNINWKNWQGEEYFNIYRKIEKWKSYLNSIKKYPPYIKILGLWYVNTYQSKMDINKFPDKTICIRYEDLILKPEKTITDIYSLFYQEPPAEVLDNAKGKKTFNLRGHKKWQQKTSNQWINEWKKISNHIWEYGIEVSKIKPLMNELGYF